MRTVVPKNAKLIPPHAKQVFKGVIFDVYQWQHKMFDGTYETFERIKRADTVRVFAIKDNKLVLLKERQSGPSEKVFYSLPGGRHDQESETELQAAQRELKEETGLEFQTWKLVSVVQREEKIDWLIYTFVASGFKAEMPRTLGAGEENNLQLCSYEEALKQADSSGRIPRDILETAGSIKGLLAQPVYKG